MFEFLSSLNHFMKILKKNILFSFILFLLINFPKINLINIGGLQQGIRLDDVLFLFFLLGCIIKRSKVRVLGGSSGVALIIFMFISSFLSFIFIEDFNFISIVFDFRWLQYFLFVYVFKDVFQKSSITVFKLTLWLQVFTSTFQVYFLNFYRSQGSFNGPWELANVALLLGLFIYFNENKKRYLLLPLVIISQSSSRMTLIAFIVIAGILFFKYLKDKKLIYSVSVFSILSFIFYLLIPTLLSTYSLDFLYNLDVIFNLLNEIKDEVALSIEFGNESSSLFYNFKDSLDGSLSMRFDMWLNLFFKYMSYQPRLIGILFGISPGQIGIIIDGLYVRLFFEFGLIGTYLFYKWIKSVFETYKDKLINSNTKYYLLVLLITGLTLDPFTSSKIMLVLSAVLCMQTSSSLNEKVI